MKITDIKAYSIESPVTDWTYVKIETDEPAAVKHPFKQEIMQPIETLARDAHGVLKTQ